MSLPDQILTVTSLGSLAEPAMVGVSVVQEGVGGR